MDTPEGIPETIEQSVTAATATAAVAPANTQDQLDYLSQRIDHAETLAVGTGTKVEAAAAASLGDAETKAKTIEQQIEAWFFEHFHNSIVSRETEMINHVRAGVDKLKQRLKAIL